MNEVRERGLALLCDAAGMIRQVLRNDLPLADAAPGRLFLRLVDTGCRIKALNFLTSLKTHGAAMDWEISVPCAEGPVALHFSGGMMGEDILIAAGGNGELAAQLYEQMMQIGNEQTNLLRTALKANAQAQATHAELESTLYDEISRLNNELVDMQRELAKKNADLERLNQEKNRFLGMAAHDLRNPLHRILIYSDFLRASTSLSPSEKEFVEVIYTSSEFMSRLVDDLLDVAKIESGQLHLDRTAADIGALVARNVALNRTLAAQKGVEIELQAEPLPTALVDTAKIEQVLNNLIGNAIKFSPPGGRIEVRLTATGDDFLIVVRDQGPGIAPEDMPMLFQPFRHGRYGSAGEKGSGLGLVIVKRIVEGHNGRIWVESTPGQGTTFYVAIPLEG